MVTPSYQKRIILLERDIHRARATFARLMVTEKGSNHLPRGKRIYLLRNAIHAFEHGRGNNWSKHATDNNTKRISSSRQQHSGNKTRNSIRTRYNIFSIDMPAIQ